MQVIIDVSKEVQNGKNYLIFAEGTRSKNGNQIGSFKGGSFKAATKAKCPIVPVALIDSFKPFDTKTISQVTVRVHFLEPLYYEEYKNMKTTEIAEIVHDRIQKIIDENCPCKVVDAELNVISQSFFMGRSSGKGFWKNLIKNTYLGCCIAFRKEVLGYILPFPRNIAMHDIWIGLSVENA